MLTLRGCLFSTDDGAEGWDTDYHWLVRRLAPIHLVEEKVFLVAAGCMTFVQKVRVESFQYR